MAGNINKHLKINKQQLLIFFLCFPHIKPESISYVFEGLDLLYNIFRVVTLMIIVILYFIQNKKPSKIFWLLFVVQLWVTFTTYLNNGDMKRAALTMASTIVVLLIVDLFINSPQNLIKGLLWNFEWIMYINLATVAFLPNGLYSHGVHNEFVCYFLGYKNSFFPYCLIAMCVAAFNLFFEKKLFRSLMLITVTYLNVLFALSSTSTVALSVTLILLLYLFISKKRTFVKYLSMKWVFIASIIMAVFLIMFDFAAKNTFISTFFENVLHKSANMSNRTIIWTLGLDMIAKKPFTGYGIGEHITWAGYDWYGHNQYLQLLLEGGIFSLLLYVAVIILIIKAFKKYKGSLSDMILLAILSGMFVYNLAEAGTSLLFFMILSIAYHVNNFVAWEGKIETFDLYKRRRKL